MSPVIASRHSTQADGSSVSNVFHIGKCDTPACLPLTLPAQGPQLLLLLATVVSSHFATALLLMQAFSAQALKYALLFASLVST